MTYADQRAHDVTWMTAEERAAYDRRLAGPVVEPDGVPEGMDPVERLARLADAIIAETGTDGDTAAQLAGNLIRKARRRP